MRTPIIALAALGLSGLLPAAELTPQLAAPSAGVTAPRVAESVRPVLPPPRGFAPEPARFVIAATVGPDGQVLTARVVRSNYPEANEAVVTAFRQWRFEPGQRDGRPVETQVLLPLRLNPAGEVAGRR